MFVDKYKAESFSLGLTVVETALLEPCRKLYNPKNNFFDKYELTKILKDWWELTYEDVDEETNVAKQESYSMQLKLAVAALLDINPEERLTSEEVY